MNLLSRIGQFLFGAFTCTLAFLFVLAGYGFIMWLFVSAFDALVSGNVDGGGGYH